MKLLFALFACVAVCSARHLTKQFDGRIVNGDLAERGQIPWQIFLVGTLPDGNSFQCGGSIISNEWILTAGHCADGVVRIDILLGATRRNETEDGRFWSNTSEIIVHPEYNRYQVENDIALVRLSTPIEYTAYIRPITLAHSNLPTPSGTLAYVSGWGILGRDLPTSNYLYYTELTTFTEFWSECSGKSTDTIICLEGENKKSASAGDSGGPLYLITSDGSPVHLGVASTAVDRYRTPNTYTRTAMYIDFINKHTGLNLP